MLGVAVGVATNQILNGGHWAWWWLALDLALAGVAAAVAHGIAALGAGEGRVVPVAWPTLIHPDGRPRTMGEVSPRDLGAHPNRYGAEGEAPYLARDVDRGLERALTVRDGGIVLVAGARLAGTTSSLARAARLRLPGHRVLGFVDDPRVPLAEMIERARPWAVRPSGAVLWLDGLRRDRLTELAAWPPDRLPDRLWVLGTVRAGEGAGPEEHPGSAVAVLRRRAVWVEVEALSPGERADLAAREAYADLRPLLSDDEQPVLLGRLMVSWDQVRAALTTTGQDAAARIALLHAVTDWYRAGIPRPLTKSVLEHVYAAYRRESAGHRAGITPVAVRAYSRALRWATRLRPDRPELIVAQAVSNGPRYVPHPLLSALADDPGDPAHWPVHDAMWRYADRFLDGEDRCRVGHTALERGAFPAARRLLDHSDAVPDALDLFLIARRVLEDGDLVEARRWFGRALEGDDPEVGARAMAGMGIVENREGREDLARSWWERAVETGRVEGASRAMANLGTLERAQGRPDRARRWWERAVALDRPEATPRAMYGLGALAYDEDRAEEARSWWERVVATGHADAAPLSLYNLGLCEEKAGHEEEARSWWERAAGTDHPSARPMAMHKLGVLAYTQGRKDLARSWWEQAARTGHAGIAPAAMHNLGGLAFVEGRTEEARTWFRRALKTGNPDICPKVMHDLGVLEYQQGRTEQARSLWERVLGTGHEAVWEAMLALGIYEDERGRVAEARGWLERASEAEDADVRRTAAARLRHLGRWSGERARADWFGRFGWQAYADPELLRTDSDAPSEGADGPATA
ncbi:hypothetical protein DZF91_18895 [Actinomadura logoneensis]|uniref:Uncharacterized protein n=1 Tax=Actinomadura logoneensis TaxID=2293572 RepID=A0A372JJW1_9ACTN|nr:hypothetical protein DZF91_18895 [Actinomadura logoneensis]